MEKKIFLKNTNFNQKIGIVLIIFSLFSSATIFAQDYSKQIDAFSKRFKDKNTEALLSNILKN